MSTTRRNCEPSVDEQSPHWLGDPFWSRLNKVENMNLRVPSRRETESRIADCKRSARSMDFDAAWQRYCDVIRELEMTAAELETLRNFSE